MRYQEVVRRYLSVRGASSREWAISESLVMCVEIDMSCDDLELGHGLFATASSSNHRVPQFLKVTLFRVRPEREPWVITGAVDDDPLTSGERVDVAQHQREVNEWVAGRLATLPPSTSTVITNRLQRKRD